MNNISYIFPFLVFRSQARLRQQEAEIAQGVRRAKATAEESIAEARERLRRSYLDASVGGSPIGETLQAS